MQVQVFNGQMEAAPAFFEYGHAAMPSGALGSGLNQTQKAMMAAKATAERKLMASLS
jgi:hypothetical protein